ncbi:RNA-directed DNA polymerase (reverse transcriptase)-related family protein [Rhynchospora pubera]|uniref:RNA-directed DNA polymerase (Reverse transcriptase)-related family protein n=1 Tax=Rhynchospora pubera TaxID=906938 RepID=A0AAV8EKM8_9POAL|nr:RNA-directed DNA polymerase (reverse transcriptase)-related family protein [Rhynchospora pubera]
MEQIDGFFTTGQMPLDMGKSNIVLVPKKEVPILITDFRPISVCNVIYKTISKLLSKRLQPYIPSMVSPTQTAFTPGRQIGDNVIILREVLHSFSLKSYTSHSFCLKVDLSKAFDRMYWPYVFDVLKLYGLPLNYVSWVKACVTSASFSININGSSDGFIRPTNGLRQGCALSPYLFILAIDVLSRLLQFLVAAGQLKGVKLSRACPVLTSLMYADDLLIFGEASYGEMTKLKEILDLFCEVSGQKIGQDKSVIWFSKNTPDFLRGFAVHLFSANPANGAEVYLGSPITANHKSDFTPLVNKIDKKLQKWKGSLLSQAGKLTLIKAVIEPTMLYALQTSVLPKTVLLNIQSKVRNFFWSNNGDKRMSLVAWKYVTVPKDLGGLGLKDLVKFSSTLHMKCLWSIVSAKEALWVQIVTAKYLQRSVIWSTRRASKCTPLWRSILAVRPLLKGSLKWQIGDGKSCRAVGQPWHELWDHFSPQNAAQRRLSVADLVNDQGTGWDSHKLIQAFGFLGALYIAFAFPSGPGLSQRSDRLIFTPSRNGSFSIKSAYKLLITDDVPTTTQHKLYQAIWYSPHILPRTRLFMWKAVRGAVPVDHVIATRLGKPLQGCVICGYPIEDVVHSLFKCPKARQVWLYSNLGLRSDALPDDMQQLLSSLLPQMSSQQLSVFATTLWYLWKYRCKEAYEGKKLNPCQVVRTSNSMSLIMRTASYAQGTIPSSIVTLDHNSQFLCYVDGSWTQNDCHGAGVAAVLLNRAQQLIQYQYTVQAASSPFHSELLSLKMAVRMVSNKGITSCCFLTDCKELSNVLNGNSGADSVEWRTYYDMLELIDLMNSSAGFSCNHVSRDMNQVADKLAKFARVNKLDRTGFTFPICCIPEC